MGTFIFGGDTDETPEGIKRKRELVRALMAAQGAPRNVGEGLNALGDGIVAAVLDRRANAAEKAGRASADAAFAPLAAMLSSAGSSGVAQELAGATPARKDDPNVGSTIDFARAGAGAAPTGDVAELEAYIRDSATKRGIDPDVAVRVARSEGLAPGVWQSNVVKNGKRETSYGPFQLLVGGGLGDKFQKIYGKSPEDPSTVRQQIDFALDEAAQGGWGPWYGAAKVGVGNRTGLEKARALGYQPAQTEVASLDPTAGMAAASPQPAAQPAAVPGYVDPKVSAQPRQQVAQAMMGNKDYYPPAPQPMQPGEVDMRTVVGALSNPFLSPGQKAVAEVLLQQEQSRRQALLEQQLKQSDPKYRLDLEKGQVELDQLRNPRMSPAEEQRIRLEREKFDYERNQPQAVPGSSRLVGPDGKVILDAVPDEPNKPSAILEYEYAKEQGFPGTFQDWEASKKGGMSLQVDPATGAVTFQQGGNIKPMTEGQSKDAVFATRAEGALTALEKNADALLSMGEGLAGSVPIVGNKLISSEYQQAQQAGKEFLQAILRKDTGAAITKEETAEYGSVYLPVPGDSEETLKQKAASRRRALEAIKAGMPPQAILAQEKALANTASATGDIQMPEGMDADVWGAMTPEERKLWQK